MNEQRIPMLHIAEGLWVGFLVGALYLLIEFTSEQGIKIWTYNLLGLQPSDLSPPMFFKWAADGQLLEISRQDLTRNVAPLTLLLWPTIAAVVGIATRRNAGILAGSLAMVAAITIMISWHETSKLALLIGVMVFLLTKIAPSLSVRVITCGWIALCIGILPAALLGPRLGLDKASWLPLSAQHRIIIWNETALHTLKNPIIGVGARTTYYLGPILEKEIPTDQRGPLMRSLSSHAHNIFLQTWFELGAIGTALLCIFGIGITRAIGKLPFDSMSYALATFAASATMAASSYGLFQYWFQAMFGLTAVCCSIGVKALKNREYSD
ncbi:O-antigen ligase family protein [Hyphomicrobium sulfonivorans]|uniref:O-antigen ligase family protein n=1 Tax=Hyphomicrobium sulfonivorans TaxID=121290 RepID=UPI0015708ED5|nr:O-antigen ligase family protein [Hyphomicrobium sulfonivorans]